MDDSDAWESSFELELLKSTTQHFIVEKPHKISFGSTIIHLNPIEAKTTPDGAADSKSINTEMISGQIVFIPPNMDCEMSTVTDAEKNEFEMFEKILLLNGITLNIKKEKNLQPVHPKKNAKYKVRSTFTTGWKMYNMPEILSNEHIVDFNETYENLQNYEKKEAIHEILHFLMLPELNDKVGFFYKWIAFNYIYEHHKKSNNKNHKGKDRDAIISIAKIFSSYDESKSLLENSHSTIEYLYEKSKSDECKCKNIHQKFEKSITEKNNEGIWESVFLTMYCMRNNFFHRGKSDEKFRDVSSLLKEISRIYLGHVVKNTL